MATAYVTTNGTYKVDVVEYLLGPTWVTAEDLTFGFYRNTGFVPQPIDVTGSPSSAQVGYGSDGTDAGGFARWSTPTAATLAVPDEMANPAVPPRNLQHDLSYLTFYGALSAGKTATRSGNTLVLGTNHGLYNGQAVVVETTNTLPGGLTELTIYYVVNRTSTAIELALSPGGSTVTLSSAGTGTHTVRPFGVVGSYPSNVNPRFCNQRPEALI